MVFINSSIKYIYEYENFLLDIIKHSPKYIVICQLQCGEFKTFYSKQNQQEFYTPIRFVNKDHFFKNIPGDLKVRNTRNLVFEKL